MDFSEWTQGSFSYVGYESNLDFNANTSFSRFSNFENGSRGDITSLTPEERQFEIERARNIGSLVDINRVINRLTASNKFIYNITDNFDMNTTIGIDYRTSKDEELDSNQLLIALGSIPEGTTDRAELARALRTNFTVTGDVNFTHKIGVNNFSFVTILGTQFFRTADRQNRIDGSQGVDGTRSINNFATQTAADFVLENANYGLYFLENVGVGGVAYLEFGGRIDKNTSAGSNTDALFLPKVGITYNLSDHEFYRNSGIDDVLSNVKLRANWTT